MAIAFIGLLLTIGAAVLGLRLYMGRPAENRLRPGEELPIVALRGPLPSNACLACPPGSCPLADAAPSPIFDVGADLLYRAFRRLLDGEPRITTLIADPQQRRVVALQRSALFRFPDVVTVEIVVIAPGRSSLALYSRARNGRYDFGVNCRRIAAWLARLRRLVEE